MDNQIKIYKPKNKIRVITATSLFDGHDVSINIIRRILQDSGVEVIHLGHNRAVDEIVKTAIEEDVQGIAISSYQGGHVEYFKYIIDLLKQNNVSHIKVFGGGGGVIVPQEIKELESYGVSKIYSPEDGAKLGLQGMINHMVEAIDFSTINETNFDLNQLSCSNKHLLANLITFAETSKQENNNYFDEIKKQIANNSNQINTPVIGITGTGGAGKSSLTDELIIRLTHDNPNINIAVISCDPSKRKSGGALLGDRIRMNAICRWNVYMRSLATRHSDTEISTALPEIIDIVKAACFDLIIIETAGIGQGDSKITDLADISIYVMTSEFGSSTQLEKIDMLDYADIVVVNKYEKIGSEDAIHDVRKQLQRNRKTWDLSAEEMPVFGTIASMFNDDGVTSLYHTICSMLHEKNFATKIKFNKQDKIVKTSTSKSVIIPSERSRYLSEIAQTVEKYHKKTKKQSELIRKSWHLLEANIYMKQIYNDDAHNESLELLKSEAHKIEKLLSHETLTTLSQWEKIKESYSKDELKYNVRGKEIKVSLYSESLSHLKIPKISIPKFKDPGQLYFWMRKENLAGYFPFTAGVFPLKRVEEDPARMFAGEGDPKRTNLRFKLLSSESKAKRLSTAFDSVTLYGCDPEKRPDIYGKVGTSGVSVCSLDDVKTLYDGFELCAPNNSVSMTINGPAPIMLAMFLNAAIDQQIDIFKAKNKKDPDLNEVEKIKKFALSNVRGTVQADILKEDQGQNTCMFSIEFALKMMGDIQQFFINNDIRNFYSVSISGYHIAEAGANPISQLAFTLANGFTYVEYYLSRGMPLDSFCPNLSFFFSNGMDAEYTVLGRVARRIWSIVIKEKYGGNVRAQMLKYHIQTSGRSLHSQDVQFNDIRTTLQALCAIYDNCNSLHTNAFDEAITTPSAESVRRAMAIQMIINKEWGIAKNENINQGSFIVDDLTDLVEEAVLSEFKRISKRGGVLGAMETGYQRNIIQEESMYYEHLKHSGELPLIGVNKFRDPDEDLNDMNSTIELARATDMEKESQLKRLDNFHKRNEKHANIAVKKLQNAALNNENVFAALMDTVKFCSLGQVTQALYNVGGQYRRNM